MAAFSDTAFNTSAFSIGAFDFGSTPPPAVDTAVPAIIGGGYNPSQGLYERQPSRKEISKARERLGLQDKLALAAIAEIAARQAERLELDEQKRFEELSRELQLRGIEWEARYLEALNLERGRLIDAEIGRLLKRKLTDETMILMLLAAAAAV